MSGAGAARPAAQQQEGRSMSAASGRALAGVFQALEQDLVTAEAVTALEGASIPAILLKGPTFAQWLYAPGEERGYADTDLLVPRPRFSEAVRILRQLGFDRKVWLCQHTHALWLVRGDRSVDLHHTLGLVDRSADAWAVLSRSTALFPVAHREVRGLDEPGRCLHAALHAAQNRLRPNGKPREDLRRALEVASDETWAAAVQLARALRCEPEMAAGLRSAEAGPDRAARLGMTDEPSARLAAREATPWRRRYRLVLVQRSWRGRFAQLARHAGKPARIVMGVVR
jgi:hypothetical protein